MLKIIKNMRIFIILFYISSIAGLCTSDNFVNDPTPWGGANCSRSTECGGIDGGTCDINTGALYGVCVCRNSRGGPNCIYVRHGNNPAGGLNVGLPFVGVGGVGNFILGHNGRGAGQLILMISAIIVTFAACCLMCCECGVVTIYILYILSGICILAGFIWSIVDGAAMLECRMTDALGYALYQA